MGVGKLHEARLVEQPIGVLVVGEQVLVELVDQLVRILADHHRHRLRGEHTAFQRAHRQHAHHPLCLVVVQPGAEAALQLLPQQVADLAERLMLRYTQHPLAGEVAPHRPGGSPVLPQLPQPARLPTGHLPQPLGQARLAWPQPRGHRRQVQPANRHPPTDAGRDQPAGRKQLDRLA
jgi:hypothetical protein